MAQLSGTEIPNNIVEKLTPVSENVEMVREIGIDLATKLCSDLMDAGVPGLHFYTMNSASSTIEIVKRIGLR
jgi:methylenetetrahydrofolate reductase (NADPH)